MKEIRILFTGVGRRVELMQAFRSAAFHTGCRLRLYGADMTFTAPALFYCDAMRQVCSMRDTDYIPELVRICQDDSIDLVIPTIDTDLLILSEHTADFAAAGTRVLISRPEMIRICRDKNYTSEFFVSCGLRAPMPVNDWREYRGKFPCFIKPKDGSSSINAFRVENPEELAVYAAEIGDYIVQPFVEGTEYTIDMFGDFDGNLIARKMLVLDSNGFASMLVSDLEATSPVNVNNYFMGWSTVPYNPGNDQQTAANTLSLYEDGYKKTVYITLYRASEGADIAVYEGVYSDASALAGHEPSFTVNTDASGGNVNLYAEYEIAHWLRFIAGETGWKNMQPSDGNSTYRNRIIDAIYNMDGKTLEEGAKYEVL